MNAGEGVMLAVAILAALFLMLSSRIKNKENQ